MTAFLSGLLSNQEVVRGVCSVLGIGIGIIVRHLIALNADDKRKAGLSDIEQAIGDAIVAAIQAAPNAPKDQIAQTAIAAARTQLLAEAPHLFRGAEALTVETLMAGHAKTKLQDSPGGAVVALPTIGGK